MTAAALPRVAVLGAPRGGTSAVVGALRLLGYRLPSGAQCLVGEAPSLRTLGPDAVSASLLTRRVSAVPEGVVWKDPGVGDYAHRVNWRGWRTVYVHRDPFDVARSERRHGYLLPVEVHERRTAARYRGIEAALASQGLEPDVRVSFDQARLDPVRLLGVLAQALDLPMPTTAAERAVSAFIRPGGSYRCPLPGACFEDHGDPWRPEAPEPL